MASLHAHHAVARPPACRRAVPRSLAHGSPTNAQARAGRRRASQGEEPSTSSTTAGTIPELIEFLKEDLQHLFDDQGIDASRYEERVEFVDPITRYNSLSGYLLNIQFLRSVFDPTFELLDIRQSGPHDVTTRWAMTMRPTFVRFGLQNFWDPTLKFTGTSVMSVNPATGAPRAARRRSSRPLVHASRKPAWTAPTRPRCARRLPPLCRPLQPPRGHVGRHRQPELPQRRGLPPHALPGV
jgi:hypothetical protein